MDPRINFVAVRCGYVCWACNSPHFSLPFENNAKPQDGNSQKPSNFLAATHDELLRLSPSSRFHFDGQFVDDDSWLFAVDDRAVTVFLVFLFVRQGSIPERVFH